MSIELDVLVELYSSMKQYIAKKDRQEAADALVSVIVDLLSDHDLKEFCSTDDLLKTALRDYAGEDDDIDDEDDY